ncbi:MAG: peptidylprolyl isomerase [Desulfotomaculum sp.]|nr:peptidylprolyl isomerase [Desulfotomaculum sp.]
MNKNKKKKNSKLQWSDPKTKVYVIILAVLMVGVAFAIGIGSVASNNSQQTEQPIDEQQPVIEKPVDQEALLETKQVVINTARGDIVLEVYPKKMPVTVANFEKLIKEEFYNGLTFHRVEDWVIQGGCPQGTGTGGPGWQIELEIHPELNNRRGMVAMARSAAPDSAGSQFYILKKDAAWLDGDYAVFGRVTQGMEIIDQIAIGDKINQMIIE